MAARVTGKASSLAKGMSIRTIPAPTGQFVVGCVDLMHELKGDLHHLWVRFFYPTIPQQQGAGYERAKWMPRIYA